MPKHLTFSPCCPQFRLVRVQPATLQALPGSSHYHKVGLCAKYSTEGLQGRPSWGPSSGTSNVFQVMLQQRHAKWLAWSHAGFAPGLVAPTHSCRSNGESLLSKASLQQQYS
jgi:hypothetical protein